ncbi:unnamed protein product, partial [Scytosiphon promiscuus]
HVRGGKFHGVERDRVACQRGVRDRCSYASASSSLRSSAARQGHRVRGQSKQGRPGRAVRVVRRDHGAGDRQGEDLERLDDRLEAPRQVHRGARRSGPALPFSTDHFQVA